jgi:triosephosphate isomerase
MSAGRRTLIAGNWKMNLRRDDARRYCERLLAAPATEAEVAIYPGFTLLPLVCDALAGSIVRWGAQDVHPQDSGAHTGDVSALQLLDWQCTTVLCGHSERRADHGESDELVAAKVATAQRHDLEPVLCIGETREERDRGATEAVLRRQLRAALPTATSHWVLAYEPVWAIGTGLSATPALAQEAHSFLRRSVAELRDPASAENLRILYGGSVKPDNCEALLLEPDIDGFLIGGASLDPSQFLDIIRRCGSPT